MNHPIHILIRRVRLRLRVRSGLDGLTIGIAGWALGSTVLLLLLKQHVLQLPDFTVAVVTLLTVPVALALRGFVRPYPASHVAWHIDRSHLHHDRLRSALEFLNAPKRTPLMDAHISQAVDQLHTIRPARAVPLRMPRHWRISLAALAFLGAISTLRLERRRSPAQRATVDSATDSVDIDSEAVAPHRASLRRLVEQAGSTDHKEVRQLALALQRWLSRLQAEDVTAGQAFTELARLERRLATSLRRDMGLVGARLRAVGRALARDPLTRAAGRALQRGRLGDAEMAWRRMARTIAQVPSARARALASTMRRATTRDQASDTRATSRDHRTGSPRRTLARLNRELRSTANALAQSNASVARRHLQRLADETRTLHDEQTKARMLRGARRQLLALKELLRRERDDDAAHEQQLERFYARARRHVERQQTSRRAQQTAPPAQTGASTANGAVSPNSTTKQSAKVKGRRRTLVVQGAPGARPVRSDVIEAAAGPEGFLAPGYRTVYEAYWEAQEEGIDREEIPPARRLLVKRYFQIIKPPPAKSGGS